MYAHLSTALNQCNQNIWPWFAPIEQSRKTHVKSDDTDEELASNKFHEYSKTHVKPVNRQQKILLTKR